MQKRWMMTRRIIKDVSSVLFGARQLGVPVDVHSGTRYIYIFFISQFSFCYLVFAFLMYYSSRYILLYPFTFSYINYKKTSSLIDQQITYIHCFTDLFFISLCKANLPAYVNNCRCNLILYCHVYKICNNSCQ